MSPVHDILNDGSESSDLTDSESRPATPGNALTPQTSPVPLSRTLAPPTNVAGPQSEEPAIGSQRRRSSARLATAPAPPLERTASSESHDDVQKGKKRRSSLKWTIEPTLPKNIFADQVVEGKRERKSAERYGGSQSQVNMQRRSSKSRSVDRSEATDAIDATENVTEAPVKDAARDDDMEDAEPKGSKKLKLNIRLKRKPDNAAIANEESEDDEGVVQTSKRRRRSGLAADDSVDQGHIPSAVSSSSMKPGKNTKMRTNRRSAPEKSGRKGLPERKKRGDSVSDGDEYEDWSAEEEEEEAKMSTDDLSDDDEDAKMSKKADAKIRKATNESVTTKPKGPPGKGKKPKASSKTTTSKHEIVPVRDLAAEAAASSQSSLPPSSSAPPTTKLTAPPTATSATSTPVRPPKAAVRKAPSSNVLSSLLGYTSRDATPSRNVTPRPRPAQSAAATGSPHVRPIDGKRPSGEAGSSSIVSARKDSASAGPSSVRMRQENPGLEGKHVTAEQMAELRVRVLQANANPRDLFDLLEGAELMMEFEDETRQRLQTDALLHRFKLYRPGRTEGMWKLVERIKENEQVE